MTSCAHAVGAAGWRKAPQAKQLVTGLKDDDEAPTIAAKLAAAPAPMALTPLLLVHADLRSPRLHTLLHCRAEPGPSQLVRGLASNVEPPRAQM
jgi:Mrp family chromosome partitioning ATPase